MKTGLLIGLATLIVAIGGYFGNEWRACGALNQEYRNFAISLIADQQIAGSVRTPEHDKMLKRKTDEAVARAAQTLVNLEDRCGAAAAAKAQASAQALVLGIDQP